MPPRDGNRGEVSPTAAVNMTYETLKDVGELDRKTYLGGSDAAAILGVDPYGKTPLTCYLAKIGESQGITDPEKLKFLSRRKRWEGPIVEMLREEFDGEIVAVNARYIDAEHDFLAAEIDFEWVDAYGMTQNGEIKTVSPFAFGENSGWGEAGSSDIPVHYYAQVMHGLGITGRQSCIVAAMVGLDNMVFYRVERDNEIISEMRAAQVAFWKDHVVPRVPPEPTTLNDALLLFRRKNGRPVELTEEQAKAFENLRQVRNQQKALGETEAELELVIAKAIFNAWNVPNEEEAPTDNAVLMWDGKPLGKWAASKGSHLDQKKLAIDHPEIKKDYTVTHYYRTFRFTKAA